MTFITLPFTLQKILVEDLPVYSKLKDGIKTDYKSFSSVCDPVYLEVLKEKVNDILSKWDKLYCKITDALKQHQVSCSKDTYKIQ